MRELSEPRPAQSLALLVIHFYQRAISPWVKPSCRFHPSCSEYTALAIESHGAAKGCVLGVRRIARCHPFGGHGYDPVP